MSGERYSAEMCQVLAEDSELGEAVPRKQRERAVRECVARTLTLYPGRWGAQQAPHLEGGIGLLILEGLLIRRVGVEQRFGAELLGEGDLLRPWQGEEEPVGLSITTGWRVLRPTRIALLDEQFGWHIAPYPHVGAQLVGRALQRARNLAVNMAIVHQARVDTRLHMLLWHLAGRWGRVGSSGVLLPLRLTHTVLADLVAARRPTVSSALSDLARRGVISSARSGWLLAGEPPGELLQLAPVQLPQPLNHAEETAAVRTQASARTESARTDSARAAGGQADGAHAPQPARRA